MKLTHKIKSAAVKGAYVANQAVPLTRMALFGGWLRATRRHPLDREQITALTNRFLLPRPLDPRELDYFEEILDERGLSDWALPLSFLRLPDSIELSYLGSLAFQNTHEARLELMRNHLPAAAQILDVGGAVDHHPEGALLACGYPHRPRRVTIVDLPDDEREFAAASGRPKDMVTPDGTEVRYVFSNMLKLEPFADESFDLVWSGQSIEHVTESEAELLLAQVRRVLRPGGFFCLDTPNRNLTKLISSRFLHPDHKIEYAPDALAAKIERFGFAVRGRLAVTPLPVSAALGRVSKLEILKERRVSEDYQNGFSFFLKCQKMA